MHPANAVKVRVTGSTWLLSAVCASSSCVSDGPCLLLPVVVRLAGQQPGALLLLQGFVEHHPPVMHNLT